MNYCNYRNDIIKNDDFKQTSSRSWQASVHIPGHYNNEY